MKEKLTYHDISQTLDEIEKSYDLLKKNNCEAHLSLVIHDIQEMMARSIPKKPESYQINLSSIIYFAYAVSMAIEDGMIPTVDLYLSQNQPMDYKPTDNYSSFLYVMYTNDNNIKRNEDIFFNASKGIYRKMCNILIYDKGLLQKCLIKLDKQLTRMAKHDFKKLKEEHLKNPPNIKELLNRFEEEINKPYVDLKRKKPTN